MPPEVREESVAVQLLKQRLGQLERQFEQHCKAQNGHLAAIDATLGKLAEVIAPAEADDLTLLPSGRVLYPSELEYPAESCPCASWITLRGIVPMTANLDRVVVPGRLFIERSEYDCESGRLTLEPRGVPSPWESTEIEEG